MDPPGRPINPPPLGYAKGGPPVETGGATEADSTDAPTAAASKPPAAAAAAAAALVEVSSSSVDRDGNGPIRISPTGFRPVLN